MKFNRLIRTVIDIDHSQSEVVAISHGKHNFGIEPTHQTELVPVHSCVLLDVGKVSLAKMKTPISFYDISC